MINSKNYKKNISVNFRFFNKKIDNEYKEDLKKFEEENKDLINDKVGSIAHEVKVVDIV
jgi:hypothetical protein